MLLFLTTNMVAVTGVTCKLTILDLYLITAPQGRVVQNWVKMTQVQCEICEKKCENAKFRYESLFIFFFAYNLLIGCSQKSRENDP